jgi:hypothetical protein
MSFVREVAPLPWGHVGACAGVLEEVEVDALLWGRGKRHDWNL